MFYKVICILFIFGFISMPANGDNEGIPKMRENCLERVNTQQEHELTASHPFTINTSTIKRITRCSRNERVVGSPNPNVADDNNEPIVTMSRRDVSERVRKRCERCRKSAICKDENQCKLLCRAFCKDVDIMENQDTTGALIATTTILPELIITEAINNNIMQLGTTNAPEIILGNRFGEATTTPPPLYNRYYTIGAFSPGASMNLVAKLLGVTDIKSIDRLIILAQTKVAQAPLQNPDILDLAKIFSTTETVTPNIHRLDGKTIQNPDLMVEFNKAIDEAIEARRRNGELNQKGYDLAVNDALNMMYKNDTFGNILGCSHEETELIPVIPPQIEPSPAIYPTYPKNSQSETKNNVNDDLPNNPPVIQDNLDPDLGTQLNTTNNKETLQSENLKRDSSEETSGRDDIITTSNPLRDDVMQIVRDNLHEVENNIGKVENLIDNIENRRKLPTRIPLRQRLRDNARSVLGKKNINSVTPNQKPIVSPFDGDIIGAKPYPYNRPKAADTDKTVKPLETSPIIAKTEKVATPNLESRTGDGRDENRLGATNEEQFNNFGMVVPENGEQNLESKSSKAFFVGNGINLPLQVLKQNDGTFQLSVDIDKMCNCKNKTCSKQHENNKMAIESDDNTLPLNVRFGEVINHESNKLDEINPTIMQQNTKADISKRSPRFETSPNQQKLDDVTQIKRINLIEQELEHKLDELNKNVKEYYNEDKKLELELKENDRSEGSIRKRMDMFSDFLKLIKRATL